MGENAAIWAVLLLAIAIVLFFVEILVPSGGLIGLLAAGALIGGIVMLFGVSTTWGLVGLLVTLLAMPFLFALAIRVWPHTPVARMLTLQNPPRPAAEAADEPGGVADLIGARGRALTDLRPIGTCLIEGRKEQCMAVGGWIDAGTPVQVVAADAMQIKVRRDDAASEAT